MYCTQCGCKVEDEFKFCPECGVSVVQGEPTNKRSELDRIVDEIYLKNKGNRAYSTKELMQKTGLDFRQAKELIERKHRSPEVTEENRKAKEQHKEEMRQVRQELGEAFARASNAFSRNRTVRCPKCGSTSISYGNKKLSIGRSAVGYGVAGPTGAVLGGLSSKKGYAVCLNCGKQWKI